MKTSEFLENIVCSSILKKKIIEEPLIIPFSGTQPPILLKLDDEVFPLILIKIPFHPICFIILLWSCTFQ
jgi:hypothetical protein